MTHQADVNNNEWHQQWSMHQDDEKFLFHDWIKPVTISEFKGKKVLEAGCGGGQHSKWMAEQAASLTSVDLNTVDLALERNQGTDNINFIKADIATMELGEQFDIVICIGVIHHTDDPDKTFHNLYKHLKPNGKMIIWTYSSEGNALVRYGVEPFRKLFLRHLPISILNMVSKFITTMVYIPVHTIYRLGFFSFLPYYDYFKNFRKLSFNRNNLNVFDKLNAPQTRFTTRQKCDEWFSPDLFNKESISILPYAGVSYSLVGIKRS
ncbi:MAG: methyltransferase domain-containing protein [Magnetococcales bacterium]|nr:methyltransferase domain-containing protein [Magnetococcales bacterium]